MITPFILIVIAFLMSTATCVWLMFTTNRVRKSYAETFQQQYRHQLKLEKEILEWHSELAAKDAMINLLRGMKYLTESADKASEECRNSLQLAIMHIQRRKMGILLPARYGENDDGTENENDVLEPAETAEQLDEKIRSTIERAKAANDLMRKEMKL